jgi:hypothetical protein
VFLCANIKNNYTKIAGATVSQTVGHGSLTFLLPNPTHRTQAAVYHYNYGQMTDRVRSIYKNRNFMFSTRERNRNNLRLMKRHRKTCITRNGSAERLANCENRCAIREKISQTDLSKIFLILLKILHFDLYHILLLSSRLYITRELRFEVSAVLYIRSNARPRRSFLGGK